MAAAGPWRGRPRRGNARWEFVHLAGRTGAPYLAGELPALIRPRDGGHTCPRSTIHRNGPYREGQSPMTAVAQEAGRAIRPFHVDVPDEALLDLRRRIEATVWPERETVP